MKYDEARRLLKHALDNQKTIRTSKLRQILMSMNISLKPKGETQEVDYLKGEIKKLNRRLKQHGIISR